MSSPVALKAMRNSVIHNDILFIVRLEEIEGALKLVALVDKQEVPGVLMTPDWSRLFPLWISVMIGKLPQIDLPLLHPDFPSMSWAPWEETVSWPRTYLQTASSSEVDCLVAEIMQSIHRREVKDSVAAIVAANGAQGLIDLINGDRAPTATGKATMSQTLFMAGVQERVAMRQKLEPSWRGDTTEDFYPIGSQVTPHSHTQLVRYFTRLNPDPPLRLGGAAGIPLPPPGGGAPGSVPVEHVPRPEGPSRRDDLAYSIAAVMTMDEVVRQVRDVMAEVPQEFLSKAVQYLNQLLAPYSSVSRIVGQIAKFREPDQVAKFLDSCVWGTGLEQAQVKASLYACCLLVAACCLLPAACWLPEMGVHPRPYPVYVHQTLKAARWPC